MILSIEIFGVPVEMVNNLTSTAMLLLCLIGAVRYLQKRNDDLVSKLEASHSDREAKLMDVIKEVNVKHEECTERYFEMASKWTEAANELKTAIEKFSWQKQI